MKRVRHRLGRIRSRFLAPGDLVYLFCPASPVKEPYRSRCREFLEGLGFKIHTGASFFASAQPLGAGSVELRQGDLEEALALKARAILPARGGYGSVHLLPYFPAKKVAALRPLWLGASDLTYLNVSLLQRGGLIHFYGPMPCGRVVDGDTVSLFALRQLLTKGEVPTFYPVTPPACSLVEGEAVGELRGGCLSILASLCGTFAAPDFRDALVLLEDRSEAVYRIERYLYQLHLSGCFSGARGLIFSFSEIPEAEECRLKEVLTRFSQKLGIPALYGLPLGHASGAVPLPMGVLAQLHPGGITLLEPVLDPV